MTVLLWVAVLVTVWFVASVVVAVVMGRYLRRCAEGVATGRGDDASRPLDTGPLALWLADLPDRTELTPGPQVPAPRRAEQAPTEQAPTGQAEATAAR